MCPSLSTVATAFATTGDDTEPLLGEEADADLPSPLFAGWETLIFSSGGRGAKEDRAGALPMFALDGAV